MRDMQRVQFYPDQGSPATLHIELPGAIVNIRVGLTDHDNHEVTAVEILPEDETRGGDAQGRVWRLADDGRRVVCQTPREPSTADTVGSESDDGIRGHWSLVTTVEPDDDEADRIAEDIRTGDTHGYVYNRD